MRDCLLTMLLAALIVVAGCEDDDIRVYTAPPDPDPPAANVAAAQQQQQQPAAASSAAQPVTWTLPEGWTAEPGSGMRYATLSFGDANEPLQLTVIPLGLASGSDLDNINRWRGQIGLPPLTAEQLPDNMETINTGGKALTYVDLVNAETHQRIVAAMVESQGRVWFFKVQGEQHAIEPHMPAIRAYLQSLRFDQPPAQAAAPPQTGGETSGGGTSGGMPATDAIVQSTKQSDWTFRYDKPAAWHVQDDPSGVRMASFIVGDVDDEEFQGEVSVTRFPGTVGGMLANINRWRGQVNLPPLNDLKEQELLRVEVDGQLAAGLDITEPMAEHVYDESERKRMVVIIVPRESGMTWFFKMSGPSGVLEENRDAFAAFMQSVKFVKPDAEKN